MVYNVYKLPNNLTFLVGTKPEDIKETIDYYRTQRGFDWPIPKDRDIKILESMKISCAFPLVSPEHFISIEAAPDFIVTVYANAYDHVKRIACVFEKLKRGPLFRFQTHPHQFFLPRCIMEGLKNYDWGKNEKQIKEWMSDRERRLTMSELNDQLIREHKGLENN